MKMVRIGQVGLGAWGKNLLRNFSSLNGCRVIAAADLEENAISKLKSDYPGVEFTADVESIMDKSKIDALVIATPPATHYELAEKALEAGLDIFVEKPLVLDVKKGEALVSKANELERVLMVGHIMEYHSATEYLKRLIDSGELGKVYYLYAVRVNLGKVRDIENSLWSFAPHDISMINYLIGSFPVKVSADGQSYLQDGIEDVAFMTLHYPGKVMAHIHVSWLDPHKDRKLTIVGSKKMVVFNDTEPSEKIRIIDKGVNISLDYATFGEYLSLRYGNVLIPYIPSSEPLKTECSHFIDCVAGRKRPRSDGADGLRVLKILDAAQRSLDNGGQPQDITG
jgi:predicted dehydrogenase